MKVGIFTRYNDTDNIIEFMKYHYSIGINYILIYNDGSSNKLENCKKHFSKNMFKIVYFKWIEKNDINILNYSRQFYESILKILKKKDVDYCFHIDNDEYIVLQQFNNVVNMINYYKPFDQVYFNWIFFGDNNIYNASSLTTLLDKNNKSEIVVSSNEPKVIINVKTAISAKSPHFFDKFNKDKTNIINKNVFNQSGIPLMNRYQPNNAFNTINKSVDISKLPVYIAHFSIITLKDFYKKRFNHISGSRLAKPNFSNIDFKNTIKENYVLIYLMTILKIKKEDFINMTIFTSSSSNTAFNTNTTTIIDPFYTMIDLYLKRNKNTITNTFFSKFINDNPELYHLSKVPIISIVNITKNIIIKMINKIISTESNKLISDSKKLILTPYATKVIMNTINNSTIEDILEYGLYTPFYLSSCQ
jgi:hypothetical protein